MRWPAHIVFGRAQLGHVLTSGHSLPNDQAGEAVWIQVTVERVQANVGMFQQHGAAVITEQGVVAQAVHGPGMCREHRRGRGQPEVDTQVNGTRRVVAPEQRAHGVKSTVLAVAVQGPGAMGCADLFIDPLPKGLGVFHLYTGQCGVAATQV